MLQVNPKAYVVTGAVVALAALAGLAGVEYQQGQTLSAQDKLVKSLVVKEDNLLKSLTPTPTATPTPVLKGIRPVVTLKPSLTKK